MKTISSTDREGPVLFDYVYHDRSWHQSEIEAMARGEVVDRGARRYRVCAVCRKVVCVNKPIIGSMHVCSE